MIWYFLTYFSPAYHKKCKSQNDKKGTVMADKAVNGSLCI